MSKQGAENKTLPDELWLQVGSYLQPKEVCHLYQATRAQTQALGDSRLLVEVIIKTLVEDLSLPGECHYDIITLGMEPTDPIVKPVSAQDYLVNKLKAFFEEKSYNLEDLKLIYSGIQSFLMLIQSAIIPGFFQNAIPGRKQHALVHIANLFPLHPTTAHFFMDFVLYLGMNINIKNAVDQTALTELLYKGDAAKESILFLLHYGANTKLLYPNEREILQSLLTRRNGYTA